MTDEMLVGKLMGALASLQSTVALQTTQINKLATEVMQLRAIVELLPCNKHPEHDTNPECLQSVRAKLHSMDEDEPDSALMRQMDLRANKSGIEVKGPSIMVLAFGAVVGVCFAVWAWVKTLPR